LHEPELNAAFLIAGHAMDGWKLETSISSAFTFRPDGGTVPVPRETGSAR
jgi:hypothetical protein